jgi:hypothetical protein
MNYGFNGRLVTYNKSLLEACVKCLILSTTLFEAVHTFSKFPLVTTKSSLLAILLALLSSFYSSHNRLTIPFQAAIHEKPAVKIGSCNMGYKLKTDALSLQRWSSPSFSFSCVERTGASCRYVWKRKEVQR